MLPYAVNAMRNVKIMKNLSVDLKLVVVVATFMEMVAKREFVTFAGVQLLAKTLAAVKSAAMRTCVQTAISVKVILLLLVSINKESFIYNMQSVIDQR